MELDPNRFPMRIPGARRLFAAAQHHIDHIMATTTAQVSPALAYDWAWDVVLQLGWDLDRLARKAEMTRAVRIELSAPVERMAA